MLVIKNVQSYETNFTFLEHYGKLGRAERF